MSFEDRLKQAIERGQQLGVDRLKVEQARTWSEEDCRRRHSQLRLSLSEYIETCVKRLPDYFPGFRYETMYGELGWGGACAREDLRLSSGSRSNEYSRLELTIRPYSNNLRVVELAGKGTIRNKELFSRSFFEPVQEAEEPKFKQLIDAWVLEYAEQYAAKG
ncbi:hypothetical protein Psta_0625 [Pirellula staleyi DSM 6068]|uniref:Uncharacterized protein n=1 Tax=Pirellula staleyi (strain ATCC 27377 / DSM 6068 / ICPB 4128) TaxID=530564 RepID=D2R4G4_PIRSD|nr:hypothetical protein [Pirellula staleyi]ADB15312.1 hypothetical protein Psta_0625 [Pirellula staleyi DSM 6068]